MEKRNTLFLAIVAIFTLLLAVVGATFAYFASNIDANAKLPVDIGTSSNQAVFTAAADGEINFTVDSFEMQEGDATNSQAQSSNESLISGLTGNASINVTLKASDDNNITTCSYDIIFTWTGGSDNFPDADTKYADMTGKDFYPSKYYVRTGADKEQTQQGFKEFTIEGTLQTGKASDESLTSSDSFKGKGERNIDTYGKPDENGVITLVSGETISSQSTTDETIAKYDFTIRFYNINEDQSDLAGKTFAGDISVANVRC